MNSREKLFMLKKPNFLMIASGLAMAFSVWAADSTLVVDRGLPSANLNNVSGAARSNVRWASGDSGFLGDHFVLGAKGEKWVIDSIRTWAVPGLEEVDPDHLGDFYQDVRLYFGAAGGDLTPVASALLSLGNDESSNRQIRITEATRAGTQLYDNFGKFLRVWQIEFTRLNLSVDGGVNYSFGVWGMGREIPGSGGKGYMWFNHASNAPLSAARQDGADGVMLLFDGSGKAAGEFTGQGSGWDKSSNINVQVFAHRLSGRQTAAE
jgi:hypothetical protein